MATKKRRSPGDGGLFKRADGMWVGSIEIPSADGRRHQKRVYAKDYRRAKQKLDELQDKIDAGLVVLTSSTTVASWLDHWLNDIKKPSLTQSTYKFYEETIRLHIVPTIGKLRLDKLTAQHVYNVINAASTTRNAQRVHLVLSMALTKAVANGVLARSVAAAIDKPDHVTTEQDTLELGEAQRVYRTALAIEQSPGYAGPLMASRWGAAFWTGARPAELRGLEWSRVDWEGEQLDLSWQLKELTMTHGCGEKVDGKYPCGRTRVSYCPSAHWGDLSPRLERRDCRGAMVWTRPKTAAGKRGVPMAKPLFEILKDHQRATMDWPNPHDLVWHHRDGRPIGVKQEWRMWRDLLDAAEVPRVDQYATRHTTATLLDELGVPEDVRMSIMGHSSKVAARAYLHTNQTRERDAIDRAADRFALTN